MGKAPSRDCATFSMMKRLLTIALIAISNLFIAQELPTIGEVFDFEPGDEFHYKYTFPVPTTNIHRYKILEREFSADTLAVTYTIYYDGFTYAPISDPDEYEYTFFGDTITQFYGGLNESIIQYDWHFELDTLSAFSTTLCADSLCGYYHEFESLDTVFIHREFGLGLGETYFHQVDADPLEGIYLMRELVYYNKQGELCGSPDYGTSDILLPDLNSELNLYPNPCSSVLTLTAESHEILGVSIIDMSGRQVTQTEFRTTVELDVTGLESGLYFAKFHKQNPLGHLGQKIFVKL